MGLSGSSAGSARLDPPEIVGLRPAVTGMLLGIRCRGCRQTFESYQVTVGGVAFGQHTCPHCGTAYEVQPEVFEAALDRYLPPCPVDEMAQLTEEASRVAETWYRKPPLSTLLTYRAINLGEPTERELLSYISLGILAAQPRRGESA